MKTQFKIVLGITALFLIVSGFLVVAVPQYRTVGAIYFLLGLFAWNVYNKKQYQDSLPGVRGKTLLKSLLVGFAVAIGFYAINKVVPMFALGYPEAMFTVSEDIRFFVIVILAPVMETVVFDCAILALFRDNDLFYFHDLKANLAKSGIFASYHTLAYGIVLGLIAKWSDVFSAYYAVAGLFVSAFIVSMIFGYIIMKKELNNPAGIVLAHGIINFILISFSIVYMG